MPSPRAWATRCAPIRSSACGSSRAVSRATQPNFTSAWIRERPSRSPPLFIFGELYDDGTEDDPNDPIIDFFFETTSVEARLDGKVLLEGVASELGEYRFGPLPFDEPIFYAEPQPRGPDLHAVAALFVLGVGSVYRPLPVGEHTLVITVDSLFFGTRQTTYHITVTPPGRG